MQVTYAQKTDLDKIEAEFEGIEVGARVAIVTGLREDEPVFVFRAQDALSVGTVSLWREMAWQSLTPERLAEVDADIAKFIEWRHENQEHVKDPD